MHLYFFLIIVFLNLIEYNLSFIGTTRRKELHGTTCIRALCGTWAEKVHASFQAYKFEFTCSNVDEYFSRFVLLIESKLDDDVGNLDLDLFLVTKTVKASMSYCGQTHLNEEQVCM